MRELRVGQLLARPGEKVFGLVEVTAGGQALKLPVFLINGAGRRPDAGRHGRHPRRRICQHRRGPRCRADPRSCRSWPGGSIIVAGGQRARLLRALDLRLPARRQESEPFLPRQCRRASPTEQLAGWVFQNVISQADYYVDLHGGDLIEALVPFTLFYRSGNAEVDRKSLEIGAGVRHPLSSCGSETAGSTYSAAARAGIPAILTEAGGQGIWTAEDVGCTARAWRAVMRHLGMLAGPAPDAGRRPGCWNASSGCAASTTAFWYPERCVGEDVRAGQELGRVRDYGATSCRRRSRRRTGGVVPGHVAGDQPGAIRCLAVGA